jgi:hypothetical protein
MNIKIRNSFLLFGAMILLSWQATGQAKKESGIVNCSQYLNQAEDEFDAGSISNIPQTLNKNGGSCFLNEGFTKEEMIQAYRLLALVHIFKDEEVEAEDAVINLLKVDPEHEKSPNDPQELIYLLEKYRSDPIFRIGIKAGVNQSFVKEIDEIGAYNTSTGSKAYTPLLGFNVEMTFEYALYKGLDVLTGIQFASNSYKVKYDAVNHAPGDTLINQFEIELTETQTTLKVPLMLRYHIPLNKIRPYVLVGGSLDYMLSSTFVGSRTGATAVPLTGLKMDELRNKFNYSYFGGVGMKLGVSKVNFFTLEARYNIAGSNAVKLENRYDSDELSFDIAHVDSAIKLSYLSFSIGYIHSFYKPKKLSEKKLKKQGAKKAKQ